MKTDILMNGSMSKPHLIKNGIRIICNTENFVPIVVPGLSSSSSASSSTMQKIEAHPNRHALQRDLQQSQSFNPFSKESQDVIKAA